MALSTKACTIDPVDLATADDDLVREVLALNGTVGRAYPASLSF